MVGARIAPTAGPGPWPWPESPPSPSQYHSFFLSIFLSQVADHRDEATSERDIVCVGEVNRSLAGVRGWASSQSCAQQCRHQRGEC